MLRAHLMTDQTIPWKIEYKVEFGLVGLVRTIFVAGLML